MPNSILSLQKEERDGILLVRMEGPLDSITHDQLRDYLEPIMAIPNVRVVLDGGKLTYINSRGITLLARYQKMAASSLAYLGIAALNRRICKAIDLLGMTSMLRMYPSVDDAMKAAAALGPAPAP